MCWEFYLGPRFDHFVDVLTEEETEEITREKKLKEAVSQNSYKI